MQKKYIVRLSGEERDTLREVVKKLKGKSRKVRRAQILLKADANGPSWSGDGGRGVIGSERSGARQRARVGARPPESPVERDPAVMRLALLERLPACYDKGSGGFFRRVVGASRITSWRTPRCECEDLNQSC